MKVKKFVRKGILVILILLVTPLVGCQTGAGKVEQIDTQTAPTPVATSTPAAIPTPTLAPIPTAIPTPTLVPTPKPTATPAPKTPPEISCCRIEQNFPKGLLVIATVDDHHSPIDPKAIRLWVKVGGTTSGVPRKVDPENPSELVFEMKARGTFYTWSEIKGGSLTVADIHGNGRTVQVDPFVYEDTGFDWQSAKSENIKVLFYGPAAGVNPERVLAEAEAILARFGFTPDYPIRIIVYEEKNHMDKALPPDSKTRRERAIVLGRAFSNMDAVFVLRCPPFGGLKSCGDGEGYFSVERHELTHLIVEYLVGEGRYRRLPKWLNEGLATYSGSKEFSDGEGRTIKKGLEMEARARELAEKLVKYEGSGELSESKEEELRAQLKQAKILSFRPLRLLKTFPGKPEQINLSYAESHSFVLFLIEGYGMDTMLEFLDLLKKNSVMSMSLEEAVEQAYGEGESLETLEAEWKESLISLYMSP